MPPGTAEPRAHHLRPLTPGCQCHSPIADSPADSPLSSISEASSCSEHKDPGLCVASKPQPPPPLASSLVSTALAAASASVSASASALEPGSSSASSPHSPQAPPQGVFDRPGQLLLGFLKRVLTGWGLHAGARLLLALLRARTRSRVHIAAALADPECLRTGVACGVLSLVYNLSHRALRLRSLAAAAAAAASAGLPAGASPTPLPDSVRARNAALSGALAGVLSWSLVRRSETSETFALHILVRALALVARHTGRRLLQARGGQLPTSVKLLMEHTDSAVFIASCTEIMYDWFYHPEALPPVYNRWITGMAQMDHRLLDALRKLKSGEARYGQHSDLLREWVPWVSGCSSEASPAHHFKPALLFPYCIDHGLDPALGDPGIAWIGCNVVHPQDGFHCAGNSARRFWRGARTSFRFYLPLHLAMHALGKYPAVLERLVSPAPLGSSEIAASLLGNLRTVLLASLRSSAFLGSFIGLVWSGVCLTRQTLRDDRALGPALGSFLSGWSVLLEKKHRRAELACYVLPRALQSLAARLAPRLALWRASRPGSMAAAIARFLPRLDVACFGASCAIFMWFYAMERRGAIRLEPVPPLLPTQPQPHLQSQLQAKASSQDPEGAQPVLVSPGRQTLIRAIQAVQQPGGKDEEANPARTLLRPTLRRAVQLLFES